MLFDDYQQRHLPPHRSPVCRVDGLSVDRRHRVRAVGVAAYVDRVGQPDPSSRLGRGRAGRHRQPVSRAARPASSGPRLDALHDRGRADADERAADPSDRRPHRDPLSRLRLAGVPGVLPGLAGADPGNRRRGARSHAARDVLAASRCMACSSRASGGGWSTRRGSSSRMCSSSCRASAAAPACARRRTARRHSSRKCGRASTPRTTRVRSPR